MNEAFIAELQHEAVSTRKLLERLPAEKWDYKPHHKSMALGELANHMVDLVGWIPGTLHYDYWDIAQEDAERSQFTNPKDLVVAFDQKVAEAIEALKAFDESGYQQAWELRKGNEVLFSMPRVVVIRSMMFNHLIHHRAQLDVYARMNDVPLPQIYGPSYDEPAF